jgi:hypothetical protein
VASTNLYGAIDGPKFEAFIAKTSALSLAKCLRCHGQRQFFIKEKW